MGNDILTLQFGPLANWTGAHYWNIQDEILGLQQRDLDGKSPVSDINPTTLYREGENPSGQPTYTPRLVLYDLSGSLGAVSTRGWAYNASEEEETESTIISTWSAPPDIRRSTRIPKSDFLQRLEEEEEEELEEEEEHREEGDDNDDGNNDGYSRGGEPLLPPPITPPLETAADKLNQTSKAGGARYFTDYLKAPLHPKSHVLLPGKWHGTTDPSLGYACLSEDSSSSSSSYYCSATQIEAMTEPIRYLAEESDGIQGFQCMVDDTSGFGKYAQQVLQEVKDDFGGSGGGGKPIMLYAIRPPSSSLSSSGGVASPGDNDGEPSSSSSSSSRQLVNANNLSLGLSTALLSELSNLYIPIQLGGKFPWLSSQWQYSNNVYQWSGVVAAALDTASLPLRLHNSAWTSSLSSSSNGSGTTGRSVYGPSHPDMWTLSQTLTQQYNTPLTALSMAFPCPMISEKDAQKVAEKTDKRQQQHHHNNNNGRSSSDSDSSSDDDNNGRAGRRGSSSANTTSYTNKGPFTSSQTVSLTPGIRRVVSQGRYSEFITLRGVRCMGEAITDVASIAPVVDAALRREKGGRCVQQRLLVAQPLPIPLGFPKMFKSGCLNRYGDYINGNNSNGNSGGNVESTGVLTRLTGTDDFRPGLERILEEFGRSSGSIMGQSMMRSWGGMEDSKEEVMERLHSLADTLSEVSNAGVNKVLNKRRRTGHTQPARQRSAIAPSVCGAPALLDQDDQTTIPEEQEEQEQEKKLPHHDEDDGMEWESEDEDDNRLPPLPLPHLNHSTVITVDATTVDDDNGKPSSSNKRKPRVTYTKEDRELARQIHRSHVLCLLGRAMLYDTAADDPTLQALMVSLVPLKILHTLPIVSNSSSNDGDKDKPKKNKKKREQWTVEDAERIVKWFSSEFKLSPHTSQQQLAIDTTVVARNNNNNNDNDDQIEAALMLGEKGVGSIIEQLTTAAEVKKGGGEELVALFVAMMRGLGGLVRSTRVVEPSSLRPGDAVKQEEHAVKRFQNRKQQQRSDVGGNEGVIDLTAEVEGGKEEEEEMTVGGIAKMLLTKAAGSGKRKKSNASNNKKKNNKKSAEDVDSAVKEEEEEEEEEGDDKMTTNDDNDNNKKNKKKKSKGELELEQQLAIAMAATAFQDPQEDADDGDTKKNKKKTTHPSSKPKPQIHRSKSASWSASLSQDIGTFWCELFIGSLTTGKWVHVDPLTCLVNKEEQVEGLRARKSALPYVVSLMGGGRNVKDVTKRYVSSYIQSQKDRDDEWWSETLRPLRKVPVELLSSSLAMEALDAGEKKRKGEENDNKRKGKESSTASGITFTTTQNNNNNNNNTTTSTINQLARLLTEREDAELHELELREKMSKPSTISAFKNHPTYVLKRHISKYQCVKPGATFCGCHNGEMYYNKEDITELHTVQKWRQLGREVVESEVYKPAKIVKKRGAAAAMVNNGSNGSGRKKEMSIDDRDDDDNEDQDDGEGMTQLYGDWQTRELTLKGAENGKVPRNERGNVEVPPFAHAMPPGCIHLNLPSIAGICRKLIKEMNNNNNNSNNNNNNTSTVIMDYAPALAGFDYRRGGAVPKIEGVVVCEEVHQMVLERYWEDRKEKEEKERKKREKEEEEARNMMKKTLEARARLEAGGGSGSKSMAEAAMMLVEEQREEKAVPRGRGRKRKQKEGGKKDGEPDLDLDLDIEEI